MPQAISQFPDNVPDIFPHGLRGSSPAPVPPAGEAVATVGGVEPCSAPTFYSAAAFVDTWIAAPRRPEPVARDFTFKAVIGEPSW